MGIVLKKFDNASDSAKSGSKTILRVKVNEASGSKDKVVKLIEPSGYTLSPKSLRFTADQYGKTVDKKVKITGPEATNVPIKAKAGGVTETARINITE